MKSQNPIILLLIFSALAGLHFSWALGSHWGFTAALPTTPEGDLLLKPTPLDSAIVGFGLMAFGIYYLLQTQWINKTLPDKLNRIIGWVIPGIFLLRAVGDFKYVGIFKPPMQTAFAQADFFFYSPLCLLIALLGFLVVRPKD
ncbi:MAG: DUF3995 domain-containing protein [Reichenbachiella sp.]|uniref:DUF3995 domain-containing protein n=1 Tax=Reichenbachiella sp. TaxID=2184521 RepID=UPI0029665C75|nr:DUF3995 domain-containing protein [Reichenbachiella sp.]MDW3211320.1 DUF3995 domain-containing protein [Reichenbachiella sp.]